MGLAEHRDNMVAIAKRERERFAEQEAARQAELDDERLHEALANDAKALRERYGATEPGAAKKARETLASEFTERMMAGADS